MNTNLLYSITGIVLFGGGMFALIACSHLLRKILAANIMSSGVFLFLIATAYRSGGLVIDPVPHAMVLTGIVVSVSTTAIALVLGYRVQQTTNRAISARSPLRASREEEDR